METGTGISGIRKFQSHTMLFSRNVCQDIANDRAYFPGGFSSIDAVMRLSSRIL